MKFHRCWTFMLLAVVILVFAECGRAETPTSSSSLSASPTPDATGAASPIAMTATTTTSASPTSAASRIELPADFAIRTAAQAESLALAGGPDTPGSQHPHVSHSWLLTQREADAAENSVGGVNEDPFALVWWVDLDGAEFEIPSCPGPLPGATPTGCGSAPLAAIQILASSGREEGLVIGRHFTPANANSSVSFPTSARLRTEGEAIAAGFQTVPGIDGRAPHLANIRLLSFQQWQHEAPLRGFQSFIDLESSTPIWELEFNQAAFSPPCLLRSCTYDHIFVAFNAINSESIGYYGKPKTFATPVDAAATPTTGATPVP